MVNRQRFTQNVRRALEKGGASTAAILLVLLFGVLGYSQVLPSAVLVWGMLAVVTFEFQRRLDQGMPLMQIMALLAVLQWLVGPMLSYGSGQIVGRYYMYVPESTYFPFAIPATAMFVAAILGVGASVRQRELLSTVDRRFFFPMGVALLFAAIAAEFLAARFSGNLAFLLFLLSQLRYIAALYFLFSGHQLRWIFFALSCGQLFLRSSSSGMFHDLLIWLAIIYTFWFAQRKWSFQAKTASLILAALLVFTIQAIKHSYREKLRRGADASIVKEVGDLVFMDPDFHQQDIVGMGIARLNQGWIISAVMKHVPEREPFADGETVQVALLNSFVPRVFWPDKQKAGGRENFRRFTGLPISDTVSMGISPLGESYANFGVTPGILFMAVYGAVVSLMYYGCLKICVRRPDFIFWIPLVFYQAIKAETELLVVLNQLSKGMIVAWVVYNVMHRFVLPSIAPRPVMTVR